MNLNAILQLKIKQNQFKNHRWIELDGAVDLKKKISENVVNEKLTMLLRSNKFLKINHPRAR